jgi:hypothetical protein
MARAVDVQPIGKSFSLASCQVLDGWDRAAKFLGYETERAEGLVTALVVDAIEQALAGAA